MPNILNVLDRIAHPSTTPTDLHQSIAGLQRLLKGKLPSDVLGSSYGERQPHRSYDAWQNEIASLKEQLAMMQAEGELSVKAKQREIKKLNTKLAEARSQAAKKINVALDDIKPDDDGNYSNVQVIAIIIAKFQKEHGVRKALVEKSQRVPGLRRITDDNLQTWRKQGYYPGWAVEQLFAMTSDDLLQNKRWTREDTEFLHDRYRADPKQTNQQLADLCTQQFGRTITDSAIRGKLTRGRNQKEIQYRLR